MWTTYRCPFLCASNTPLFHPAFQILNDAVASMFLIIINALSMDTWWWTAFFQFQYIYRHTNSRYSFLSDWTLQYVGLKEVCFCFMYQFNRVFFFIACILIKFPEPTSQTHGVTAEQSRTFGSVIVGSEGLTGPFSLCLFFLESVHSASGFPAVASTVTSSFNCHRSRCCFSSSATRFSQCSRFWKAYFCWKLLQAEWKRKWFGLWNGSIIFKVT